MAEATRKLTRTATARAKTVKNLNDIDTQEAILSPVGRLIVLGDHAYTLYPLSGRSVRKFMGFAQQVFASAWGIGDATARISGVLTEQFLDRFLPYLAEAVFESPAEVKQPQLEKVMQEIDMATQSTGGALDLANAFAELCEQNHIVEAFEDAPKRRKAISTQRRTP